MFGEGISKLFFDVLAYFPELFDIVLEEVLEKGEVLEMCMYFVIIDVRLEVLAYDFDVISNFFDEEL